MLKIEKNLELIRALSNGTVRFDCGEETYVVICDTFKFQDGDVKMLDATAIPLRETIFGWKDSCDADTNS